MDIADIDFLDADNQKHDNYRSSSTSSSDSRISKYYYSSHPLANNRPLGRQMLLHEVLGSGKSDVILWRNKQTSGGIFAGATVLWLLFEWIGLLTFVCHFLMFSLTILFMWSKFASYTNISPPDIPRLTLRDDSIARIALVIRRELNQWSRAFKEIALGKNFKKFLLVILTSWVASIIGGWFDFLTLVYLAFMMLLILPVIYEKHEDTVNAAAVKALVEIKQQYAVLDNMFLRTLLSFRRNFKYD